MGLTCHAGQVSQTTATIKCLAAVACRPLHLLTNSRKLLAGVKRLAKLGMVADAPGMSALDMNTAEDAIVQHTREVVDGMVICGMEVSHCHSNHGASCCATACLQACATAHIVQN